VSVGRRAPSFLYINVWYVYNYVPVYVLADSGLKKNELKVAEQGSKQVVGSKRPVDHQAAVSNIVHIKCTAGYIM